MKKVGEEGAEKLAAVYNKPNDDTAVRIEVYCKTANNDNTNIWGAILCTKCCCELYISSLNSMKSCEVDTLIIFCCCYC